MSAERRRRVAASPLALGLLSGVLAATSFRWAATAPVVFVAFVPVIAAARRSWRAAALAGALTGMVGYSIVFAWLPRTIERFQVISLPYAWLCFVAGVVCHAPQVALFALGVSVIATHPGRTSAARHRLRDVLPIVLGVAALWTVLEWGYPKVFPWALGGALAPDRLLRQVADIGGVYGLGFVIIVVNAVLAVAIEAPPCSPIRRRGPIAALAVIGALTAYGAWRTASRGDDVDAPRPVRVAVVQGVLAPDQEYGETAAREALDIYEGLTDRLFTSSTSDEGGPPEVIVWPEATLPVYLRTDQWYRDRIERLVARTGRPLVVGALDRFEEPAGEFNAAYAFLPARAAPGETRGFPQPQVYHKTHLVPWAEYIPGGRWLPFLRRWRTTGELIPGTERDAFVVDLSPGQAPLRMAPSICLEVLQAGWFNPLVRAGATVLANITDDGWYAGSIVPDLHLQLARMRAVETRRWLVRSSNSGISAFIDPTGEIVASLPFGEAGALAHTIIPSEQLTPYVRFGDWVVWLSVCIVVVSVARRLQSARVTVGGPVPRETESIRSAMAAAIATGEKTRM